eukprot:1142190-Pelagomonas_calceolata.AAC.7
MNHGAKDVHLLADITPVAFQRSGRALAGQRKLDRNIRLGFNHTAVKVRLTKQSKRTWWKRVVYKGITMILALKSLTQCSLLNANDRIRQWLQGCFLLKIL